MAFDIEMIKSYYETLGEKMLVIKEKLNRPLTLAEKILYSHLDHKDKDRRKRYRARHKVYIKPGYYSSGDFSMRFLWT